MCCHGSRFSFSWWFFSKTSPELHLLYIINLSHPVLEQQMNKLILMYIRFHQMLLLSTSQNYQNQIQGLQMIVQIQVPWMRTLLGTYQMMFLWLPPPQVFNIVMLQGTYSKMNLILSMMMGWGIMHQLAVSLGWIFPG